MQDVFRRAAPVEGDVLPVSKQRLRLRSTGLRSVALWEEDLHWMQAEVTR